MNLGYASQQAGHFGGAVEALSRAVAMRPTDPDPYCRLGGVLGNMERHEEAADCFRRAISLQPDHAMAHVDLAFQLQQLGDVEKAIELGRRAILLEPNNRLAHANLLFAMLLSDVINPEELLAAHERWAEGSALSGSSPVTAHDNDRSPDRMLRLGYISPNLNNHSVATFLLPILEKHDRRRFHVTCYSNSWLDDAMTARIRAAAHRLALRPPIGPTIGSSHRLPRIGSMSLSIWRSTAREIACTSSRASRRRFS